MKLDGGLLFDGENDDVGATNANGGVTLAHSYERVFDFKSLMAMAQRDRDWRHSPFPKEKKKLINPTHRLVSYRAT